MFANTLTLTYKTVGYVLNRINQDNFGSEYSFLDSVQKFSLKIRHSNETAKAGSPIVARHNVLLEHTIYATATVPQQIRTVALTMRAEALSDPQTLSDLNSCLEAWTSVAANSLALAQGVN